MGIIPITKIKSLSSITYNNFKSDKGYFLHFDLFISLDWPIRVNYFILVIIHLRVLLKLIC